MDVKKIVRTLVCTTIAKDAGPAVKFIAEDGTYYLIALSLMLDAYYRQSCRENITVNLPDTKGFKYHAEWIDRGTYDRLNIYKEKEQVAYLNMDKNFLGNLSKAFHKYIPHWLRDYE